MDINNNLIGLNYTCSYSAIPLYGITIVSMMHAGNILVEVNIILCVGGSKQSSIPRSTMLTRSECVKLSMAALPH